VKFGGFILLQVPLIRNFPIAASTPHLFNHESGFDDDTSAMTAFIETAPMDMGDGDKFLSLRRVIPDLTFIGSVTGSSPNATFTVKARDFPGSDFNQTGTGTTSRTATSPVEQFTEKLDYRIRGRSFAIRQITREYVEDLVRTLEIFISQERNPGELRATKITLTDLPTSSSGLETGALFNDSGTIKIVT
jgi:hypothetical protein